MQKEYSFYFGFDSRSLQGNYELARMIKDQDELPVFVFDPLNPEKLVNWKYEEGLNMTYIVSFYDEDKDEFTVIDDRQIDIKEINLYEDRSIKKWESSYNF